MSLPSLGHLPRAGCRGLQARALLLALVVLVPVRLHAQQAQPVTLTGRVVSDAGQPLPNAQVSVEQLGVGTTTRVDGTYTILVPGARVPSGPVTVTARLIGYKSRTESVDLTGGPRTLEFQLASNPLQLGEIVVTGAGTVSTAERLGTVRSSVDSTAIIRSNEPNVVNALAAKAPNVNVVSSSGEPGVSSFIQIRGLTSIQASDGQPLFVIDGQPVNNRTDFDNPGQLGVNGGANRPNRLIDVNPDDIENVEILKGAASGAIYGSRAGQGVVLITTKKGRAGPTRFSLRTNWQLDEHTQLPPLQRTFGLGTGGVTPACVPSTDPALQNCAVGFTAAGSWGPLIPAGTPTFDHASEMLRNGYTTDNALSVSGGNDRTTFFLSGGYNYQRGIVVGPDNKYRRIAVRFNGSQRLTDNLRAGANIAYSNGAGGFVQSRNSTAGLMLGAWRTTPTFNNLPFLDPITALHRSYRFPNPGPGSEQTSRRYDNPFFVANEEPGTSDVSRTFGNINADWSPLGWLKFSYTLGLDYSNDERLQAWPLTNSITAPPSGVSGVGGLNAGYIKTSILDHNLTATANYTLSRAFKGTVTIGQNLNATTFQTRQSLGTGLIAPQPFNLGNTTQVLPPPFDHKERTHLESYFGQVTADLWERLFLTGALRNDGASTFGASSRRNWFPKASAAWLFRRDQGGGEGTRWLTYGKLRAGYGQSGTQPQPYLLANVYLSQLILDGGWGPQLSNQINGVGGLLTTFNLPSQNLGPERVKEFEAGFDLGLFDDKADLSVTHYRQNSTGLILAIPVASSVGYSSQYANAASLQNRGWEVALNVRPITHRNFGLELGLQWARNRGKTTDLAGVRFQPFPTGGGNNGLGNIQSVAIVGEPVGVFYGSDFVRCGRGLLVNDINIDNTAGECAGAPAGALYIGPDGLPVFDAIGNYVLGDPNPDWTGSLRANVRIARLSVGGLLDVRHGGLAYNGTIGALNHFGTSLESQVRREGPPVVFGTDFMPGSVSGPGAGTAVPLNEAWFTGQGGVFNGPQSQFLQDGGFVKLRELSLGYTFDQPWVGRTLGFASIELRLAARNLVSWNDYIGVDPETGILGAASPARGYDYFNNPQSRSWAISLTLNR